MKSIIHIAIPCPLNQHFDYFSDESIDHWQPGIRVKISFRNKEVIGLTLGASELTTETKTEKLKPILERIDQTPLLDEQSLKLINWVSQYYHYPIGECFQAALPKKLRSIEPAELKTETYWQILSNQETPKLGNKQQAIFDVLAESKQPISQSALRQQLGSITPSLNSLESKGLIAQQQNVVLPTSSTTRRSFCTLNEQQHTAFEAVKEKLNQFQPFLLAGITGSGKTEVYIQLAHKVIQQGKQVLVLIPEIGLTSQFVERFKQQLDATIVVLHSGINDTERKQGWLLAKQGLADVVIGTRSSVFTPLKSTGLIIIDEEHDGSYKQQDGLRYHARSVALIRAQRAKVPVVLGSATPSLESLYHVEQQRYQKLVLDKRAGEASLPKVSVIDSSGSDVEFGLSQPLIKAITEHLENGNQILLFVNRRGYAPVLMCHECDWQAKCKDCDALMVVHKSKNGLYCHHCGLIQRLPNQCPQCQTKELYDYGVGTQKIEEILQHRFSDVPVLRIDRDTTQGINAFDQLVEQMQQPEPKILVGTQMLAKGHDFHHVTLVGILDADQGLFSADFRATEQLAQLVTQVTGRAGRGDKKGEVYIQSQQPQHPFWSLLLKQGYEKTAETLLAERTDMAWPPVGALCVIRAESQFQEQALQLLTEMAELFNQAQQTEVMIMGPVPAIMEKRAGRYRAQLLLSSHHRKFIHPLLDHYLPIFAKLKLAKKCRWSVDIDPVDLL
jgi:primosomal protein N' (replication factor Y)